MRFVDHYDTLFFDMNGTFMFGHDRLTENEDFFSTYRRLGGLRLNSEEVRNHVQQICACLRRDYDDPTRFDSFPSLLDAAASYSELQGQDAKDIAGVIAAHELGTVPRWAAETLRALSDTHSLVLVTNVWAPADTWTPELQRCGLSSVFRHQVFSSSLGVVKPSPRIFHAALKLASVSPQSALFIGDSLERDIIPAKEIGFGTALIAPSQQSTVADVTIRFIQELLQHNDA